MSGEFQRRAGEAWRWFRAFPLVVQFIAVAVVLAAVLALFGNVEATVSRVRDWWFDRSQVEAEAERDALRVERDAAIDRAERAEAQAELLEAQIGAQKELLQQSGARVRAADKVVDDVVREMETEIERVGADTATADERRARIRERLRALGYLPR
jgi:hypothetical protein